MNLLIILLNKKKVSWLFGYLAEILVIFILFVSGYRIVNHRLRNFYGEIDIIAIKNKALFFVEVKWRRKLDMSLNPMPCYQMKRIKRAAHYFLEKNNYGRYKTFDVFFVLYRLSWFSILKSYF